ncbi:mitochondrial import inner membrane translocase subunit Tim13-like [Clytia hemisphaerica]|uniref:Mitochondrial import inner membrane translocase subunit n=1 Tax=Clytia hemisphaerica TaxID=252671 RepID=A0A7M5X6P7_9CNID
MSDYSSFGSSSLDSLSSSSGFESSSRYGSSGGQPSSSQMMEAVKQQIAVANAQELLSKMSDKCFKKCITKPGANLDNSEQKCLAMCMDRYMEAWNLVSQTYTNRLNKEHSMQGGSGSGVPSGLM